jgi:hypothetical protein
MPSGLCYARSHSGCSPGGRASCALTRPEPSPIWATDVNGLRWAEYWSYRRLRNYFAGCSRKVGRLVALPRFRLDPARNNPAV